MADSAYDYDTYDTDQQAAPVRKRGVDVFTLIAGLAVLFVSAYVLTDGSSWLPGLDLRWILAGGAVFVGLMLFGASFRKRT